MQLQKLGGCNFTHTKIQFSNAIRESFRNAKTVHRELLNVERRARVNEALQQQLALAGSRCVQTTTNFDLFALQGQHQARLHQHSKLHIGVMKNAQIEHKKRIIFSGYRREGGRF